MWCFVVGMFGIRFIERRSVDFYIIFRGRVERLLEVGNLTVWIVATFYLPNRL